MRFLVVNKMMLLLNSWPSNASIDIGSPVNNTKVDKF